MNNQKGILLMIAAMAGFTVEDVFVKLLSSTVSIGQILITIGLVSSLFFALMSVKKRHNLFAPAVWTKATIARIFAEAVAATAFVLSLSLVPISTVAAVFQVTPLTITMGAALFLGESVGWRRWLAICIGFIGVLLIVKPGLSGFDPSVLWVLVAVLGVAVRDLVTRVIPINVASSIISFQAFASLVFAGFVVLFITSDNLVPITKTEVIFFCCAIVFSVIGYYAIVSAMRVGQASIVAPYRYTRLIFSLLVGILVFNERLDTLTLLGAAIIMGTGLYTFVRERRLSKHELGESNMGI